MIIKVIIIKSIYVEQVNEYVPLFICTRGHQCPNKKVSKWYDQDLNKTYFANSQFKAYKIFTILIQEKTKSIRQELTLCHNEIMFLKLKA